MIPVETQAAIQSVLWRNHDMRQIFTYTAFSAFCRNSQRPDEGEEYDQLWKLRIVFEKLKKAYAKFYNPSQHLAVDKVTVKFKSRVIFRQYIPKKKGNVSASKFTNSVMNQGICMT